MISKEDLFKAFGKLLYAVAGADGEIQEEEKKVLTQVLSHHRYAFDIIASFQSIANTQDNIEEACNNALKCFNHYGYFEGYTEFQLILEDLAIACNGVSPEEKVFIDRFASQLKQLVQTTNPNN